MIAKGSGRVVEVLKGVWPSKVVMPKLAPASMAVSRRMLTRAKRRVLARIRASRGGRASLPPYLMLSARLGRRVSKRRKKREGMTKKRRRRARVPNICILRGPWERTRVVQVM